jgi:hypothetical protein
METTEQLFICDTMYVVLTLLSTTILNLLLTSHLFNTSGSGKTCLALDGLCHHWGFYFSCQRKLDSVSGGSGNFEETIRVTWG